MSNTEVELASTWAPSSRVIESVAEAEGVDPVALDPPLNAVVDLDALDELFSQTGGVPRASGRVEFEYCDYHVVVEGDGAVTVEPKDAPSP
ncbi:hypothetical protein G9464_09925 [Halostella sp. JP-L12]|uniref:HalOD1 output domain-containing protein n=1 Tax=Halostella TaxID=1843185 RepID=UPI000EF7BD7E|nr:MULTISPECIES: HalOD1 output domain-containing protein [Halostella]NHN47914.1 hypothetical protein [Halostella sp. JP-L12]